MKDCTNWTTLEIICEVKCRFELFYLGLLPPAGVMER